ncbi:carboxylating nicotinate-nucleotide diphosphorylase [Corynebacterium epidermidicanis]|uniref:Nicotinate-nucleotide pyrophosphorylase [carboxylating] n=1 Tax=Corynebacterium epidermidicanis TaxID=1050174 RepID=A0A0G3GQJ9_9CORY|nr:carboxylating nicotinate-nucleotide diphosphorylase [Corynebacterium epidermidicanis]AKK03476.1 nicotinate-nucleotide pyrophosphorylase (carboxylating) [Corynebacterium epidermidicanis]
MTALQIDLEAARPIITMAIAEDLAYGPDITTLATVAATHRCTARVISREAGIVAGTPLIDFTLRLVAEAVNHDDSFSVDVLIADGEPVRPGDCVAVIESNTSLLLTAERTLLNLVCHLSGVASETARWVAAVDGTGAKIRDSRKTMPGLRALQKYAVRAGGGVNHRMGLGDQAMVKDNHVVAAGSVLNALRLVREQYPEIPCEVEVDTLKQLDEVLLAAPEEILIDNFETWETQVAVQRRNALSPQTKLEASGGLTLDRAREVAACGVEYLAVGSLTHSVRALDLGLDF